MNNTLLTPEKAEIIGAQFLKLHNLSRALLDTFRTVARVSPNGHTLQPDLEAAFLQAATFMTATQINALVKAANPKAARKIEEGMHTTESVKDFLHYCFNDGFAHALQPSLYVPEVTAESARTRMETAIYMSEGMDGINNTFRQIFASAGVTSPTFDHLSRVFESGVAQMRAHIDTVANQLGMQDDDLDITRRRIVMQKLEVGDDTGWTGLSYLKPMDPAVWPALRA